MRRFLIAALAAGGLLAIGPPAGATLMLTADINGSIISCADQAACDTNLAVGQLAIANQVVGGVQFLGSAQTQQIGPPFNSLNTTSFQVINLTGGTVQYQIAVSGTNFAAPVVTTSESASGTFQTGIGSTIDNQFFADTANTQGATTATDLPGVMLADSGLITATTLTDSFNFNADAAFLASLPFSMALGTSGQLTAGASLVGRSQAIVSEVAVPEPGSLLILGTGLVGLWGTLRWRRRQRHDGGGNSFAIA